MQNAETYYSLLRVTNADGYVYVLRSDGVTIHNQPLVPGSVFDGDVFGIDLNVVSSKEQATCNWDGFGIVRNENHEEILTGKGTYFENLKSSLNCNITFTFVIKFSFCAFESR